LGRVVGERGKDIAVMEEQRMTRTAKNAAKREAEGKGAPVTDKMENADKEEIRARREQEANKKKRKRAGKTVAKVIIWLVVIAVVIFLTLFLAAKIGEFDSIGHMIEYIKSQF